MLAMWQTLKNLVLPRYSLMWDTTVQNKKKGTEGIDMRGNEFGLAIKKAIKTIALREDVRKVTVMLIAYYVRVCDF